jgi:hypothetical protein
MNGFRHKAGMTGMSVLPSTSIAQIEFIFYRPENSADLSAQLRYTDYSSEIQSDIQSKLSNLLL